jgi:Zn-dependent protease/CBS domain-containing protein
MPGSFRIGKIAGISIEINYSWLIILVLLSASLALSWFPSLYPGWTQAAYWAVGIISSLLLFVSVLVHELAHSLVARARGLPVSSITLFIFGGVSNLEREPTTAGMEFQVAVVGPVTSLIIGAICWEIGLALPQGTPVRAVLVYLGITNVLLGIFNLIPGFPLDGGRVLRSIIWGATGSLRTATRWTAGVGQVFAFLFIFVGIWLFFAGNFVGGIWIGFIGWFLLDAARSANNQVMLESVFRGVTVGQLMTPIPITVDPDASIGYLVHDLMVPYALRATPVVQNGKLVGLITLHETRHVPRDRWLTTPVREAMIPLDRLHVVRPDQSLNEVLPLIAGRDVNQLPVVQDGQLVGMLSRDKILRFIEVRRGLDLQAGGRSDAAQRPDPPRAPEARDTPPPDQQG